MSDKALGDALLKLDLMPPSMPSSAQVAQLVDSDRRRIRWLTWITVALWVLAAAGAFLVLIIAGFTFPLIGRIMQQVKEGNLENQDKMFEVLTKVTGMSVLIGSFSFALLVLAGLATVRLVFRSRRATLRQINANLLHISEQLKRLQSATPDRGTTPSTQ